MTRYEYELVTIPANDHRTIVTMMNNLGAEGWQCVDVRWAAVSQYNIYTFMRPVQPIAAVTVDAEHNK